MYKKDILIWVRNDFKRNKELKDQVILNLIFQIKHSIFSFKTKTSINFEITRGKKSLNELKISMNLAK
jgi:hypothetical protein